MGTIPTWRGSDLPTTLRTSKHTSKSTRVHFFAQHTRSLHTPKGGACRVTFCIHMHGPQRGAPSCQTWDTAAWHHTHFAAGLKQHGLHTVQHAVRGLWFLQPQARGPRGQRTTDAKARPQASTQPAGGKPCRLLYPDAGFSLLLLALIIQPRHPASAMDAHSSLCPG